MRILLSLFFVISTSTSYAQYGADGAVAGAAHTIIWVAEKKDFETIKDAQQTLIVTNATLALATAKLSDISKKKYKAATTIDEDMSNAKTLALVVPKGTKMTNKILDIYNVTADYPEVTALISPALEDLLLEIGLLVYDTTIEIATKDGQVNMMNSAERYQYIRILLNDMDSISQDASEILRQAKSLIKLIEFANREDLEVERLRAYNATQAILQAKELIDNLIIED